MYYNFLKVYTGVFATTVCNPVNLLGHCVHECWIWVVVDPIVGIPLLCGFDFLVGCWADSSYPSRLFKPTLLNTPEPVEASACFKYN